MHSYLEWSGVHWSTGGSQQQLIHMIFCHVIIIHDHLYSSLLPGIFETRTCRATYVLCRDWCENKPACTLYRTVGRMVWCCLDPPYCSDTSLWGFGVFSWCNMLGSWQSCRALSSLSKRHGISPNVLWLEFWSFKIFFFFSTLVFSPLPPPFFSPVLSASASLCLCKSENHRIMSSSSSCGEPRSLLQPTASLIWILFKINHPTFPWKVILSLKPINAGSFKITFALLWGSWESMCARGTDYPFQMKYLTTEMWDSTRSKTCRWTIPISH